jgi:hypothetical protein
LLLNVESGRFLLVLSYWISFATGVVTSDVVVAIVVTGGS